MNEHDLPAGVVSLLRSADSAALASHSRKHPEYPFTSLVSYALDSQHRPLILISGLATHTKNIESNPRVSMLVTADNTLAGARATLIGDVQQVPDEDRDAELASYLKRHPAAKQWASFGDFRLMRLALQDIYFVGGFGVMGWVSPADYLTACEVG